MKKSLTTSFNLGLIAFLTLLPALTHGQVVDQAISTTPAPLLVKQRQLAELAELTNQLTSPGELSLNQADQEDWATLTNKDTGLYDHRLLTQLLPNLTNNLDHLTVDALRRNHATEATKKSDEISGATNTSQHYYGKAASITSVGLTSCAAETYFPRTFEGSEQVWLHWQTGDADEQTPNGIFERSFDKMARAAFWAESRSFTRRFIGSTTWSNFLQQLAKGEIEKRFGLPAGSLAYTAVSDLDSLLAKARIAQQLGIVTLPEAKSETDFYTQLGQHITEKELDLPFDSFVGTSWREIYQRVALRVLDITASLPQDVTKDTTTTPIDQLISPSNSHLQQLTSRLEARSKLYPDPQIAFNLPTEEYLTTGESSSIFTRILNADPDAYAIVGAYFMADSLEFSPVATQRFIGQIANGEDRAPNLAEGRPIDPSLSPTTLFANQPNALTAQFEKIGRSQESIMTEHLSRLNGAVLLALSDSNRTPTLDTVINNLVDETKRPTLLQAVAKASIADANYYVADSEGRLQKDSEGQPLSGFSNENLVRRGQELLAEALGANQSEVEALESDASGEDTQLLAARFDTVMGWPDQTTLHLAQNSTAIDLDKLILETGAKLLWQRLELTENESALLNHLYLGTTEPTSAGAGDDEDQLGDLGETGTLGDSGDGSNDGSGETINFAIPAAQQTLLKRLSVTTELDASDTALLLTGRFLPAMYRMSLSVINSRTLTNSESDLLDEIDKPATELDPSLITPTETLLRPSYFEAIAKAVEADDTYFLWRSTREEVIYQWNMDCSNKKEQADKAIERLVDTLISLPYDEAGTAQVTSRPIQILTYNKEGLNDSLHDKIGQAYPNADGKNTKWGVYTNPRDFDHLYISY